jgi:hypothetical protein
MAIGIGLPILIGIVAAAFLRSYDGDVPFFFRALGVIFLAPSLVLGGYTFLRDSELEPYQGQDLLIRVVACSAAYAAIWGVYTWIRYVLELDQMEIWQLGVVAIAAIAAGGFAAFASFDLDFLVGTMHYGLYLIVTVILAYLAKANPF